MMHRLEPEWDIASIWRSVGLTTLRTAHNIQVHQRAALSKQRNSPDKRARGSIGPSPARVVLTRSDRNPYASNVDQTTVKAYGHDSGLRPRCSFQKNPSHTFLCVGAGNRASKKERMGHGYADPLQPILNMSRTIMSERYPLLKPARKGCYRENKFTNSYRVHCADPTRFRAKQN
jgi:hypothetical protein